MVEREDGGHYSRLQRFLDRQDLGHTASNQLAVELGLKCPQRAEVDHLTKEQLEKVRQAWYAPNNMTLIVVGELDKLLPAYLERTWGALEPVEPSEHRPLPDISTSAAHDSTLTRGFIGDGAKLHWMVPEPVLDDQYDQTFDTSGYLDWALYRQIRLNHGCLRAWANASVRRSAHEPQADLDRDDVDEAFRCLKPQGRPLKTARRRHLRPHQTPLSPTRRGRARNSAMADYYCSALTITGGRSPTRPDSARRDTGKQRTRRCAS